MIHRESALSSANNFVTDRKCMRCTQPHDRQQQPEENTLEQIKN